jgi:hypothetical protein
MPRGENLKGKGGPGRPKGLRNKVTVNLKTAVEEAFNQLGGAKWLVRLARREPAAFASLLGKLLPKAVELGFDGSLDVNLYQERLENARKKAAEARSHGN